MFDSKTLGKDWIYAGEASLEIEEIVLGTLINFPNNFYKYGNDIHINFFHHTYTRTIFSMITEINRETKLDILILIDRIGKKKFGEKDDYENYIHEICDRSRTDVHLEEHIKILSDYCKKRALKDLSEYIMKEIPHTLNPDEIINEINIHLTNINSIVNDVDFDPVNEMSIVVKSMESETNDDIIHSGLEDLDKFIYGFELGELIVLAAAPSMGKTAVTLEIFRKKIQHNIPSAFFSLEMTKKQLITRLISTESEVSTTTMRKKQMTTDDWNAVHKGIKRLEVNNWYIEDSMFDAIKICNKIKKLFYQKGIRIFFIDYLQICSIYLGKNMLREQEIAMMSRMFKLLCKELNIVIIALSQINRGVSHRPNKRPTLSDLRESGAIEQDADMVLFLYRESYYNLQDAVPFVEDMEIIIAKGRQTGVGIVKTKYCSSIGKVVNIGEHTYNQYIKKIAEEKNENPVIHENPKEEGPKYSTSHGSPDEFDFGPSEINPGEDPF